LKVLDLPAQTTYADRDILTVAKEGKLSLLRISCPSLSVERLACFVGSRSLLLTKALDTYFLSVDDRLLASRDLLEWKEVLAVRRGNVLWHLCETPYGLIAQEYGERPTALYLSPDGYRWTRLITNQEVDSDSRHFHYVAYDSLRQLVYATLGDRNLIRAVQLRKDSTWSPLVGGPWQFVPVCVSNERVIFGFDSAIVHGGVGIYYPEDLRWRFLFLEWRGLAHAQFACIARRGGLYLGALGTPQAVVVSRDLREWHPLFIQGFDERFNAHMIVSQGGSPLACSTGKSLLILDENELEGPAFGASPVMVSYRAYRDRLKGHGFVLRRRLSRTWRPSIGETLSNASGTEASRASISASSAEAASEMQGASALYT